jgi:sulfonate transport system permease protein
LAALTTKKQLQIRPAIAGIVLPAIVVLIWHIASARSPITPGVAEVFDVLVHPTRVPAHLDSPSLLSSALISLTRVVVGYTLAVFTAVPLGLAVARNRFMRSAVTPLVELIRPICPIAWLPIAILVFGLSSIGTLLYGDHAWRHDLLDQIGLAMIVIIWWGAFFPILLASIHGVERVRILYLETGRMLGATGPRLYWHIIIPAALPTIFNGMRVGLGIAWMVIVAAEIFPTARAGLGYMIVTSHQVTEYEYSFACIIVIGLIGFAMNTALRAVSHRVGHWQAKER